VKIEKEEFKPVCPHCEKRLEKFVEVKRRWHEGGHVICCPFCRKILAISGMH